MRNVKFAQAAAAALAAIMSLLPKVGVAQPGNYPNFTDAGTHLNPATWTQYGNWGYVSAEAGSGGVDVASMQVNYGLGDIFVDAALSLNGSEQNRTLNAGMQLGGIVAAGVSAKPDGNASVGVLGIVRPGAQVLLRGSLETDVKTHISAAAMEARRAFAGGLELTLSGKVQADSSGKIVWKGIGMQVGENVLLVSGGVGGRDWRDVKLHARRWVGKGAIVDAHVKVINGQFRKPQVSVGLTKMLN